MPMPINNLSPTGAALGLGRIPGLGGALGNQVGDETEEERRRRMALLAQQRQLGPGGSPAAASLFGGSVLGGIGF
jgi:hypothetical protein